MRYKRLALTTVALLITLSISILAADYVSAGIANNAASDILAASSAKPVLHKPKSKSSAVDVSRYGAIGDGRTDDSAALTRAFTQAPTGSTVLLAAGKIYAHNTTLRVTVPGLRISGSATLLATNAAYSTLDIQANDVTVSGGVTLRFSTAGVTRQSSGASTMIFINKSAGTFIDGVTVDGSPSAGIMAFGASNFKVNNTVVKNTLADSFHATFGSHDGQITNSKSINSGDDGFANVSYLGDGAQVYNMVYVNDIVQNQQWGRGFTVVGGHDISFTSISSDGTAGAAIYLAAEHEYGTYGVRNVHIEGAVLNRSNTVAAIDHGAVLVYNSQPNYGIADVVIDHVVITNTRPDAPRQVAIQGGSGAGSTRIGLNNFTITGALQPLNVTGNPVTYNSSGWLVNGDAITSHTSFTP